jgi:hypothetical protein
MVEQVKQEILAAFAGVKRPAAQALIGLSKGDFPQEEQIRGELAGRPWDSLESAFLAQRWPYFVYLSAEGYRYYLPALLMACLDNFTQENPLIHSTVYSLTPSAWSLYYRGSDQNFNDQVSLFSQAQRAAVSSFLGLVFDRLPGYRYASAAAIKWGWSLPGAPATHKSAAYYHELSHYTYPPAVEPRVAALVAQIRAAFQDTPYPGDDRLCGSSQGDEPAGYALEFRGLDWRIIHPDFLSFNYACLSFFSSAGFRYFLPAYLVADVMELESSSDPVFHLTYGLVEENTAAIIEDLAQSGDLSGEILEFARKNEQKPEFDGFQLALEKFAPFTLAEKQAIVAYLDYSAQNNPYARERIESALERYWRKAIS